MTGAYKLVGQRFGHLVALEVSGKSKGGSYLLRCRCDCGTEKTVRYEHLRNGGVRSCGCLSGALRASKMWGVPRTSGAHPLKRPPTILADRVIIHLTQGLEAIVDVADAELAAFNWTPCKTRNGFYVKRQHNGRMVLLHRVVAERAGMSIDGLEVDHRDSNPLNCRRENLRVATHEQNSRNMKLSRANTSGAKGVRKNRRAGTWSARIHANGREHFLGTFLTMEEAANAYRKASEELHGEFGKT